MKTFLSFLTLWVLLFWSVYANVEDLPKETSLEWLYQQLDIFLEKNSTKWNVLEEKINQLIPNIDEWHKWYNVLIWFKNYFDSQKLLEKWAENVVSLDFKWVNYEIQRLTVYKDVEEYPYWPLVFPENNIFATLVYKYRGEWKRYNFYIETNNKRYYPTHQIDHIDRDKDGEYDDWSYRWELNFDLPLSVLKNGGLYISNKCSHRGNNGVECIDDWVDKLVDSIFWTEKEKDQEEVTIIRIGALKDMTIRDLSIEEDTDYFPTCKYYITEFGYKISNLQCLSVETKKPYEGMPAKIFYDLVQDEYSYELEISDSFVWDQYCSDRNWSLTCLWINDWEVSQITEIY